MALYTHHLPPGRRTRSPTSRRTRKQFTLIGLVDMYGIPAQQVQQIRRNLRGKAVIKVTRNTLIKHAFEEIGGDTKKLTST
jgi:large subunit ribosomal protein L10